MGKLVEFCGDGLADLPLADRATIASTAPGYDATCGFFPMDEITLGYLHLSGRPENTVKLVEAYSKKQSLWREEGHEPALADTLHLDMDEVETSLAEPKRPQDRVVLQNVASVFNEFLGLQLHPSSTEGDRLLSESGGGTVVGTSVVSGEIDYQYGGQAHRLKNGTVTITVITSYTNTFNPSVMMAVSLSAKKTVGKGLQHKSWVKSPLVPGSKAITDYPKAADLTRHLDELDFDLVGYGCITCISNSGSLLEPIEKAIQQADLTVAPVLSDDRNFGGHVHPLVKTSWLASPPPVMAYVLTGSAWINLSEEPLGTGKDGQPVYLKDIRPSQKEITEATQKVDTEMLYKEYAEVFAGDEGWQAIQVPQSNTYEWQADSTYVQHPSFLEHIVKVSPVVIDVEQAWVLAVLGGSVTIDHILPVGNTKADSPAGCYLCEHDVEPEGFSSYGSRRGNHEVMTRGTFISTRVKNEMLGGEEGGNTLYVPSGEKLAIYDAAMRYQRDGTLLVIVAGEEYGTGPSRDWAARGTNLLGMKAVIAESFRRIYRSNLVGMGVLPLQSKNGQDRKSLKLTGKEVLNIRSLDDEFKPHMSPSMEVIREDGNQDNFKALYCIDTLNRVEYLETGSILHYVPCNMF